MAHWSGTTRRKDFVVRQLNELILEWTDCRFEVVASESDKLKNERSTQYKWQKEAALEYLKTCDLCDEHKLAYAQVVADRLRDIRDAPYDVNRNCFGAVKKECHERRDDEKKTHHMVVNGGQFYLWKDFEFDDVIKLAESK